MQCSIRHHNYERQRIVNDSCWCILGNLQGNRLLVVINNLLEVFVGKPECEMLTVPSWKWASTECQQLLAIHYGELQHDVAVMVYIHGFDSVGTLKGSQRLSGSSVNETSCYCPGECGGIIQYIFSSRVCHLLLYGCLWSSGTHITENATPKIVDALLTLIVKMG